MSSSESSFTSIPLQKELRVRLSSPQLLYDYIIQNGGVDQIWPMSRCLSKEATRLTKLA